VLTIFAEPVEDRLVIRVLDDGVGLPSGWQIETCGGLGLSITKERVIGLYPAGQSRFEVRRRSDQGTEVEITLPLRMAGDVAHELDIA
jgi:glucose-6-phosphate-specific signal transduction histidine kinase